MQSSDDSIVAKKENLLKSQVELRQLYYVNPVNSLSLMPIRQQPLAVMNAHNLGKKGKKKKDTTSSNASPCRPYSQLANAQGGIIAVCWKEVHAQRTQQS